MLHYKSVADSPFTIFGAFAGNYLEKLGGHTDVVSDIGFHPLLPQLLTASMDGKLRVFANGTKAKR